MRYVRAAVLLAALAQVAIALCLHPVAAAANIGTDLGVEGLSVVGGESLWHPENDFRLTWSPVGGAALGMIDSVDYRIRDGAGNALGPTVRSGSSKQELRQVHIPAVAGLGRALPGRYTVEVWFESTGGDGPHANATLRFDDARPASARAQSPAGWIRAGSDAVVEIEHPAGPPPASGIRGYAVALDHGSGAVPCAGPDSCSEAETDLRAGVDGDSIFFGPLFEGTNVAVVVAVSGAGLRSEVAGRTALHVDGSEPRVILRGAPQGWSNRPVPVTAVASDSQSGLAAAGPNGPLTSISIDEGIPTVAAGGSVSTTVRGDGAHRVSFYGRDAVGNSGEAHPDSTAIRIDETPPRVAFAKSQDPSEPERVEATVADGLSGAGPTAGLISVRAAGSSAQFTPLPTKVTAGKLTALWDSDSYPVGSYEFRATGYDAAGNSAESNRRLDGPRMVLANPLKRATQIEFGFGGRQMVWNRCARGPGGTRCHRETIAAFERRPAVRMVPYGRGAPVAGRLISASGVPLPGETVELTETFAAGAATPSRTTTVQSGPDGAFLAHLAPGPSRGVEVRFAGSKLLSRSNGRTVRLAVRAALRFHASSATAAIGGAPVIFSGQIAHTSATIPATGRPIELQFRVGDTPWSEFRTVQTDARGRFRYPYSFSDDDSRGVRFQFRAYAPAQPGWPYEPGFSRPVAVTGR
jgi:hypothetical protein